MDERDILFMVGAAFGALFVGWGGRAMWFGLRTRLWPSVRGSITHSSVFRDVSQTTEDDGQGNRRSVTKVSYEFLLGYRYEVQGKAFEGRWVDATRQAKSAPSPDGAQAWVQKYPVGAEVEVYFDRSNPSNAVLEPGVRFGCVGVFLFGLAIILGAVLLRRAAEPLPY